MSLPSHGANPQTLYEKMNVSMPSSIIDLSENSNPLGPPSIIKDRWAEWFQAISSYPDPEGKTLKQVIASFHHVQENQVLIGNGAAELMMVAAKLWQHKTIGVIHPAFSEYERVILANGAKLQRFYTDERSNWQVDSFQIEAFLSKGHSLFICNPVNPTGMVYQVELLEKWLKLAEHSNGMILLDEAFIDMLGEEHSMSDWTGSPNLLIFRSMTKMFSLAGLRLGYLLGNKDVLNEISALLPHWNVNALAQLAGQAVLQDSAFQQKTRSYIKAERQRIFNFLKNAGFRTSESKANYYLLQPPDPGKTAQLFKWLLGKGIVLRHTENYIGLDGRWLRAGIKSQKENDQLMQAVKKWKLEESSR
ncbi:threonine-phosphate decarboxylase CobD [Jeotgalibacillus sp. ET6]|uniref:threonine-phosphate decarboxylase CobD n=1 Tax=Jeotgalibacillus sp. ET6 TaxID=3037260 RepID=UPI002418650C|nr:threonine-phosphate decarboxylase CobD [Jeotgalibacillus sp. ET6]MDG5471136.1 threonine-phosphate decarboxylase CobD [Jeotgalibacillus sp. ET6]